MLATFYGYAGGRFDAASREFRGFRSVTAMTADGNTEVTTFGQEAVSRRDLTGRPDLGTGPLGLLGNVVWFLVAGWWLAIGHLTSSLACFVTIIGIPFGLQHIKLALIALAPIGMQVVDRR